MAVRPPEPVGLIRALAPRYGIDPAAAIAVARTEGGLVNRPNDIGDQAGGGSYGPFQLYAQGALPAQFRGRQQQADSWAWSRPGIEYALRKMAEVGARGLTGQQAVEAIVRRFERPADPDSQVAKALGLLGELGAAAASAAPAGPVATAPSPDPRRAQALALLAQRRPSRRRGLIQELAGRQDTPAEAVMEPGPEPARAGAAPAGPMRGLRELFYDPKGGYDEGKFIGPIGGHGQHLHASIDNPKLMLWLIQDAQRRGLAARENPYTDQVDPVHTKGSFHYSNFPGRYDGKQLGRAVDISGDPAKLAALWEAVLQRAGVRR